MANRRDAVSAKRAWPFAALAAACASSTQSAPPPATSQAAVAAQAQTAQVQAPAGEGAVSVTAGLLPPMPVAVTSFGAAADATPLYALGGYFGEPHEYSREGHAALTSGTSVDADADAGVPDTERGDRW